MKSSIVTAACFVGVTFCAGAMAADYTAADDLFDLRRADNHGSVTSAINAYENTLRTTAGAERVHGLTRVVQLRIFEASYVKGLSTSAKKEAFDRCYDSAERLNPKNFPRIKVPQYYALRTLCLAQWAKLEKNPVRKLMRVPVLKSLVNQGLAQPDAQVLFYGYGMRRVAAAIMINPASDVAGLYDRAKGLRLMSNSGDGVFSPNNLEKNYEGDVLLVRDYPENFRYRAEALVANGFKDQAKAVLDGKIAELTQAAADGLLPTGREPEALGELEYMKAYRATLN